MHPGGCPLTPRELEMVARLAEGLSYKQIAQQESISPNTVRTHMTNAYGKLGLADRAQTVLHAQKMGWIEGGPSATQARELMLLRNIESLLDRLVGAIEGRHEAEGITPAQRSYLRAFDAYLRAPTTPMSADARDRMVHRLMFVLAEAGVDGRVHSFQRRAA